MKTPTIPTTPTTLRQPAKRLDDIHPLMCEADENVMPIADAGDLFYELETGRPAPDLGGEGEDLLRAHAKAGFLAGMVFAFQIIRRHALVTSLLRKRTRR